MNFQCKVLCTIFKGKIIQSPYHNVGKCAVELYQAKLFNNQLLYLKLPFIYNMQKIKMLNNHCIRPFDAVKNYVY